MSRPPAAVAPATFEADRPQVAAVVRVAIVVAILLAAGGLLYAGFVKKVHDRGDDIVDVSLKSKEARPHLQLGGSAILCFAASGLVSFAPAVRGRRLAPLLGLGLALVPAALVGMTAFSVGRTAFRLALVVAAPTLITMGIACAVPPRARPGLGRFLARSWMATGFLLGLVLLALAGLEIAEAAKPRVPWASVFAALAVGTLVQLAARYVGMHGNRPTAIAVDHRQVRSVHDNDAIRSVATRLHPFIEEGRAGDDYALLAAELGTAGRSQAPAIAPGALGLPVLPGPQAAAVATLRAAAIALPLTVLVPVVGVPCAVAATGLVLPMARKSLNPRHDPTPRLWWLAGALVMAAGGAWIGWHLTGLGFERLTWPCAGAFAAPHVVMLLVSLAPRRLPGHLPYLRLEHARALGRGWGKQVKRALALAAGALGVPVLVATASLLTGVDLPDVPWPILLTLAGSGLLWALGGVLCGPAAARHRRRLGAEHDAGVAARARAHRSFLDRLEMT